MSCYSSSASNRRSFLISTIAGVSAILPNPTISNSLVYADPDRYGDKELKVSIVNKIRQNIRDTILTDPNLAPLFLKIAIQDALTYDATSEEGGPDGSILAAILSKNAPASLSSLKGAAEKLDGLSKKLKGKTEITQADIVAYAGAEAIETCGGPRIIIQLGKLDPKTPKTYSADSYPDICGSNSGKEIVTAFKKSGLNERDVALLYGCLGSMEDIAVASSVKDDLEEEEENEMGDKEVFIPTSFGAPSEIYGKQLIGGKVNTNYLKKVAADLKARKTTVANVFMDDNVGNFAIKYASNSAGFMKELPETYIRLMNLGTRFTGGKMGNLLGGKESAI